MVSTFSQFLRHGPYGLNETSVYLMKPVPNMALALTMASEERKFWPIAGTRGFHFKKKTYISAIGRMFEVAHLPV